MRIAVGVDAGGTSTVAAVSGDGDLLRKRNGPPSNASSHGIRTAGTAIADTILESLEGASPNAIYVGAAGAGRTEVARELEIFLLGRFPNAAIHVRDDAHIALRAGVPHGDASVLVAGTGSIAYAEVGAECFRSGGYGYLVGDDGSGFSIGAAAIKHVLRTHDGRVPRDDFADAIEKQLDARSPMDILDRVYAGEGAVALVASLAPVVLELANSGARFAARIVQQAALDLSDLLKGLAKRSGIGGSSPIVFAGGLLRENSMLSFLVESRLHSDLPDMAIHKNAIDPALCAMSLADRLACGAPT
ncbi:MAG: hypothetical protein M3Y18_02960 [Candidatus Eremiobacteraeota bacterium]|nr:hypothetical protein [Candidatus Eremiobacteraeota bacterium]